MSAARAIAAAALFSAFAPLAVSAETEPSPAGATASAPVQAGPVASQSPAPGKGGSAAVKKAPATANQAAKQAKAPPGGGKTGSPGEPSAMTPTPPVCFRVSIQCFSTAKAKPAAAAAGPRAPMDLRAPDIARIFPRTELQEKLPDPNEEKEIQETVEISGTREMGPVSVGLMALPWAVMHPTQAWRIFMPLPPSETK